MNTHSLTNWGTSANTESSRTDRRVKKVHSRQCEVQFADRMTTVLVRFLYAGGRVNILSVIETPQDELRHRLGFNEIEKLKSECMTSMKDEEASHD